MSSVRQNIYIFLHSFFLFLQPTSNQKIRLSGYGVELAVKKTEYKAVDDSKVKDDAAGKVQETDDTNEDEVEGFLFGKLRFVSIKAVEILKQGTILEEDVSSLSDIAFPSVATLSADQDKILSRGLDAFLFPCCAMI